MSNGIVHELRSWTHAPDARPASDLMDEAAAEIERLGGIIEDYAKVCQFSQRDIYKLTAEVSRLRLTIAEREAIKVVESDYSDNDMDAGCWQIAATLRGLLGRHFPTPDNRPLREITPEKNANHGEVSVRPECAISPAWMAKPFWVDPAAGWSYGFPKLYDPAKDGDMNAWLVANGYPQYLADKNLPCTFTAKIDSQ